MKTASMGNKFYAVVLAAGEGVRMCSETPKVLHTVAGIPMIERVLNAVRNTGVQKVCIVLGHGKDRIEHHIKSHKDFSHVDIVHQKKQLGSADAFAQARRIINRKNIHHCLVLCGDTPLIEKSELINLMRMHLAKHASATILSAQCENPFGYGRIKREASGAVAAIIEEKDATESEKKISEINSGMYCFKLSDVLRVLPRIRPNNVKKEYYLTDAIQLIRQEGKDVHACCIDDYSRIMGINDRIQLAQAEDVLRYSVLYARMRSGVTIIDPSSTYVDETVKIDRDTILHPGVMLKGQTNIGKSCVIGPQSFIQNSHIAHHVTVRSSYVIDSHIKSRTSIGPFAHVRPGSSIGPGVKIGNFVEVKNTTIGEAVKAGHLAYLGDADIKKKVNIGAGTIICNYDGVSKHKTRIGEAAFIGSNVSLVAPVRIGKNSLVAAGSTITENIPSGKLAFARSRQVIKNKKKR
ncbi:MAG: bifunctional UDP-N-acetylglucosamine diphosphorylase/glucosamine-1-phosphate N-acetyltransferase GlmU [bacterium]